MPELVECIDARVLACNLHVALKAPHGGRRFALPPATMAEPFGFNHRTPFRPDALLLRCSSGAASLVTG
jgi:hypothetical protein